MYMSSGGGGSYIAPKPKVIPPQLPPNGVGAADPWYTNYLAAHPAQYSTPAPNFVDTPGQSGGQSAPRIPNKPTWDPDSDPMVKAMRGQSDLDEQQASGRRLSLQKHDLLGFGSQSLARSILGDDSFINTISDDPNKSFSFLANLKRGYGIPIGQHEDWIGAARQGKIPEMEESLNPDNLWFSSFHGDQLKQLEQQRLGEQDAEQSRIQGNLASYQQSYLDVVNQAKQNIQRAILERQAAFQDRLSQWNDLYG